MKADVTMRFDGQTAKMVQEILKLKQKMEELGPAATKMGTEVAGAFDKVDASFEKFSKADLGKGLMEQFGLPTSPMGIATKAFQLFGEAIDDAEAKAKRAADTIKSLADPLKGLAQVSNPQTYSARIMKVDELAQKHGMPKAEALAAMNEAINSGLEDQIDLIMEAKRLASPEKVANSLGKMRANFPNEKPRDMINMQMAAQENSQVFLEQFSGDIAVAASAAATQGWSPEEIFAAVAQMANKRKSAKIGAQRIATFTRAIGNNKYFGTALKGMGLYEGIDALDAPDNEIERDKFLMGNREAAEAYEDLKLMRPIVEAEIKKAAGARGFTKGQKGDRLSGAVALLDSPTLADGSPNPAFLNHQLDLANAERAAAEEERYGPYEVQTNAAIQRRMARSTRSGELGFKGTFREKGMRMGQTLGLNERGLEVAGDIASGDYGGGVSGAMTSVLVQSLQCLKQLVSNTERGNSNAGGILNHANAGNE